MKIALITNSRIPSRTANSIQAMKVAQALMQLGHELRMVAPAEGERLPREALLAHYGLRLAPQIEWLPSRRGLKRLDFILLARRATRGFDPDLVYTWLPQSAALALHGGLPVVLEMHADVAGRMGAWWLRRFWRARGHKRMTVTAAALRAALERSTGLRFPDDSLRIAPNGVELERYADLPDPRGARRMLDLPEGPTAGFTGHIYPGRGAELLFELARRLPAVNFLWAGGTPDLVDLWRGRLREAGLANVTLTGFVPHAEIPLHQAAADLLLMPYSRSVSASSGQDIAGVINPMKMFEYMAAGRAIVTADLASIREVLDEETAVFCRAGEADAVSDDVAESWRAAIESLLADEPRRLALGARARRAAQRHTWVSRQEAILEGFASA